MGNRPCLPSSSLSPNSPGRSDTTGLVDTSSFRPRILSNPPAAQVCPEPEAHSPQVVTHVVRSLQRQLSARDRRIAELQSQLDALKAIDQNATKSKAFVMPSP